MKYTFVAIAFLSVILLASASPTAALASPMVLPAAGSPSAEQNSSYTLSLSMPAYYVQESGDVILFVFIAVDSGGTKVAVAFGNGTTGWHYPYAQWTQEWFKPETSVKVEGEGYLIVAALLLKNVWPSGWRTVDQCFGIVPKFNNETSMPYAITFNQDFRMILLYSVKAET
ncbi:MAG: hypothetical protein KIH01_07935 [Candidatus Freyarchaeota archaeon]|nr:hypothetical protein [Candidatus Jordarchaeia archaeon]